MARFVPCLDPPPLPTEDGRLSPSSVLLDDRAYLSAVAVSNATTAIGSMSTGCPVEVSLCLARPPRLSYLCAHFPGPATCRAVGTIFGPAAGTAAVRCVTEAPRVISTHAELALIRVTIPGSEGLSDAEAYDYFVYTARPAPGASSLDRLPMPQPSRSRDSDAAIVRCSASRYVIACLRTTFNPLEFVLQRYDSGTRLWTSTPLRLDAPERDRVLPIPDTATEVLFHDTTKVITLGGPSATVGWVDLWRGVLYCNVLDEKPELRDLPLPRPRRRNKRSFCRGCPYAYRDIAVVTLPEQDVMVKYVEIETRPGDVPLPPQRPAVDHSSSDSDDEDVHGTVVAYYWKATVWTMPVPMASWKDWHKDYKLDVTDVVVDNPRHSELLLTLPRHGADPEEAKWSLRRLVTAHPALGLGMDDGNVIYLVSKVNVMDNDGWVIAVNARDGKLKGVAQLDQRKNFSFRRYHRPTGISKHLVQATGDAGMLVRTSRKKKVASR